MILRILRPRSKSASRRSLGVLAIFWLNLAVMPCAMAIEADTENEPCPMMSDQAMVQKGHHESQADADCLSMQSVCCSIVQATADNRSSAEKLQKDASPACSTPPAWPALQTTFVRQHDLRPPDPDLCFPPLHVLNCVYLD